MMPMQWDVLRGLFQMYNNDEVKVVEFLRQYFSTPTGRSELLSGGKGMNVDEFVNRLLAAFHDSEAKP